jgi:hypothetical protein
LSAAQAPELELGSGPPALDVDRDDGLRVRLAGPVGSQQLLLYSLSAAPSVARFVWLDLGNQFTALANGGSFVIPPAGFVELHYPPAQLPLPPAGGLDFRAQSLQLGSGLPFPSGPVRALRLLP